MFKRKGYFWKASLSTKIMKYHPDSIPSPILIPLIPQVTDGSWDLGEMARKLGAFVGAKIVVQI